MSNLLSALTTRGTLFLQPTYAYIKKKCVQSAYFKTYCVIAERYCFYDYNYILLSLKTIFSSQCFLFGTIKYSYLYCMDNLLITLSLFSFCCE